jgi:hypothetical protein
MKISCLKIFLVIAAIIIAVLAIVPFFINPIAQRIVEKNVYPVFENRLKIGSVNISLLLWMVELKDIELRQPAGFGDGAMLKASSIKGYFSAIPVLGNELSLRDITVIKPEFTIILTRDKKINTDYIIVSKPGDAESHKESDTESTANTVNEKTSSSSVPAGSSTTPFSVAINRLDITNGTYIMYDHTLRSDKPTLVVSELNISLKDILMPNVEDTQTVFTITGSLTSKQRKSPVNCSGDGVFFKKPFTLTAQNKIDNIGLSDYYYFYPDTAVTIKDGNAWVNSKVTIKNNYLDSSHHVDVKNLTLSSRDKTLFGKTFLGLPAAGLMKVLETTSGGLDFDFQVKGNFNKLKFTMRERIIEEVAKAVAKKVGSLAGSSLSVPEKAKDLGYKAVDELNRLFNKLK